jgi:hypothetical protein
MQHAQIDAATAPADMSTPTSCGGPPWTDEYNQNWAGHVVPASNVNQSALTWSESQWRFNGVPGTGSDNTGGEWTGTGDSVLIQSGTGEQASNPPTYWFWNEDLPELPRNEGPAVHAGDLIFDETDYQGNDTALYYEENESTNVYQSFDKQGNTPYDGYRAADFIYELNTAAGNPGLPDFGSIPVSNSAFGTDSQNWDLSTNNNRFIITTNCQEGGTPLEDTGRVDSSGDYTITYETSGPVCGF